MTDWPIVSLTGALVLITGYYAWQNKRMVDQNARMVQELRLQREEMRQQLNEMRRQTLLQVRPFLALRLTDTGFRIDNIGRGVARDVRVRDVRVSEAAVVENYIIVEWAPIDFVPDRDGRDLSGIAYQVSSGRKAEVGTERFKTWMAHFGVHGKREYEFVLDYEDVIGQRYQAVFNVNRGRVRLLRDDQIAGGVDRSA